MKQVICIVGPTGVGKTKLSIALAKKYNGEIINADSTQIYKGLDIATAKVKEAEKENIPHYLFDIKELDENYTVFDYQKDARKKIEEILSRKKTPILVGGTGLYIKAALYNYELEEEANYISSYPEDTSTLYQRLLQIDPNTQIHPHNRKRIERALRYYEATGKRLSEKEQANTLLYEVVVIGLTMNRTALYDRINQRVDHMVEEGLVEEAKKLYDRQLRSKAIMTPIGYKELFPYFEGTFPLDVCLDKIKQHSRNYAKRQYTWFSHQMEVNWLEVNLNHFEYTIEEACKIIENR